MNTVRLKNVIFALGTVFCLASVTTGCGDDKQQEPAPETQATSPSQSAEQPATEPAVTPETERQVPEQAAAEQPQQAPADKQPDTAAEAAGASASDDQQHGEMLALARKSGCLACHSVDKKVVGPAWKDVAGRYAGQAGVREQLIEKVSKGGRGNWTDVVGNVAMPPYHPRVSKENIGKLVDFVLSLAES